MKKTFWRLAALMFMAAPIMTSCNKDVTKETLPEAQSNIVTITIAPPAAEFGTRVALGGEKGLTITGWELDDEVMLYKTSGNTNESWEIEGTGVSFKCIDAATGTFSAELEAGDKLDNYNLATCGATVVRDEEFGSFCFIPKTKCSQNLKDVIVMASWKAGNTYTMKVINNVLKIKNNESADVDVAWSADDNSGEPEAFIPMARWDVSVPAWKGTELSCLLGDYKGWNASHFTLKAGVVSYVNMGLCNNSDEKWGLAKEDGTEFLSRKAVGDKVGKMGKLFKAGTIPAPDPITITIDGSFTDWNNPAIAGSSVHDAAFPALAEIKAYMDETNLYIYYRSEKRSFLHNVRICVDTDGDSKTGKSHWCLPDSGYEFMCNLTPFSMQGIYTAPDGGNTLVSSLNGSATCAKAEDAEADTCELEMLIPRDKLEAEFPFTADHIAIAIYSLGNPYWNKTGTLPSDHALKVSTSNE